MIQIKRIIPANPRPSSLRVSPYYKISVDGNVVATCQSYKEALKWKREVANG